MASRRAAWAWSQSVVSSQELMVSSSSALGRGSPSGGMSLVRKLSATRSRSRAMLRIGWTIAKDVQHNASPGSGGIVAV